MDESVRDDSFALTDMGVPLTNYPRLRDTFYRQLKPFLIEPDPGGPVYAAPRDELKGSSLLRDLHDDKKIEVARRVVNLVVGNGLPLYRVGSRAKGAFESCFSARNDRKVSVCWLYMTHAIADLLEQGLVIPVMDLCPKEQYSEMARLVTSMDSARQTRLRESISTPRSENLGELLLADSKSSSMTQVVDVVSWLRCISDDHALGVDLSDFKRRLLPLARQLDRNVAYEDPDRIRWETIYRSRSDRGTVSSNNP